MIDCPLQFGKKAKKRLQECSLLAQLSNFNARCARNSKVRKVQCSLMLGLKNTRILVFVLALCSEKSSMQNYFEISSVPDSCRLLFSATNTHVLVSVGKYTK